MKGIEQTERAEFDRGQLASVLREHGDEKARPLSVWGASNDDLLILDLVRTILRQRARIQELLSIAALNSPARRAAAAE